MKTILKIRFIYVVLVGLLFLTAGCSNKVYPTKQWYKGNLHAHSYWSDGQEFPEMVMNWYKTNDYHFTVLSDHNTLAEGDKWVTISEKEYLQKGFQNYLKKYGEGWVNYQVDSLGKIKVKLKTLQEYKPLFEVDNSFLSSNQKKLAQNLIKNQFILMLQISKKI